MIPSEILQKVKQIEIKTKHLVNDLFGGEYHSAFKGMGMEFAEVREYTPGDDVRSIDWNVTARTGKPFIKKFDEERELTVMLMVDVSASSHYGTGDSLKSDIITELASILSFSAIKNNDKVGLLLFSNEIEKFIPPKKGKSHVLRVIREIIYHSSDGNYTDVAHAFDYIQKMLKRRAVIFCISDFWDAKFEKQVKLTNRKHDLVNIRILDESELRIPDIGLISFHDSETKNQISYFSKGGRNLTIAKNIIDEYSKFCKKNKIDLIDINVQEGYLEPLVKFFSKRSLK